MASPLEQSLEASLESSLEPEVRTEREEAAALQRQPSEETADDGSEEDYNQELERDRDANDQRLKSRFEGIFDKYGRDFTEVGDEIDIETGRIVVDNGHLANMQHEADPGQNASSQFVRAFAEDLEHEDESGSAVETEDSSESSDGSESDGTVSACETSLAGDTDHDDFDTQGQSAESIPSPGAGEAIPIDPLLEHLTATGLANPASLAITRREVAGEGLCGALQGNERSSEDSDALSAASFNVMDMPMVKESMLALKSKGKRAKNFDPDTIQALGMSIANQIAQFIGGGEFTSKDKQPKKRKDATWDFPELPADKRRRTGTPPPQRPQLPRLSSVISPGAKPRLEPKESIWAPVRHPAPRKRKRASEKQQSKRREQLQPAVETVQEELGPLPPVVNDVDQQAADEPPDELQDQAEPVVLRKCYNCGICATPTWRKGPQGDLCNACGMYLYRYGLMKPPRQATPEHELEEEAQEELEQRINSHYSANTSRPITGSNRGARFTVEEDALIIKLKEFDRLSWENIARYFDGRTAYAAQCRYSKKLIGECEGRQALVDQGFNFDSLRELTEQEDQILVQLREESHMDFTTIAKHIPDQTAESVEARYNVLMGVNLERDDDRYDRLGRLKPSRNPDLPKNAGATWTPAEHEKLIKLREVERLSWDAVAQEFPGRSGMSLQKRYVRELHYRKETVKRGGVDPYAHLFRVGHFTAIDLDEEVSERRKEILKLMERSQFSKLEDIILMRLRNDQKMRWGDIAKQLPERSADLLQARYEYLLATSVMPGGTSREDQPLQDALASECPAQDGSRPLLEGSLLRRKVRYTRGEDRLILKLRVEQGLDWEQVAEHFPGRSAQALESRYAKKLKHDRPFELEESELEGGRQKNGAVCRDILGEVADSQDEDGGTPLEDDSEVFHGCDQHFMLAPYSGVLPAADLPGVDDLSDSELVASDAPNMSTLKESRRGSKYSKWERGLLIKLRGEGRGWDDMAQYFPGRTATSLSSYWSSHMGSRKTQADKRTSLTTQERTAMTPLLRHALFSEVWRPSSGEPAPMNLFNRLLQGGTTATVADELPPTPDLAKQEKAAKNPHSSPKRTPLIRTPLHPSSNARSLQQETTSAKQLSLSSHASPTLSRPHIGPSTRFETTSQIDNATELRIVAANYEDEDVAMAPEEPGTPVQQHELHRALQMTLSQPPTPMQLTPSSLSKYYTPARYNHQSLPYYAAPVAQTDSPLCGNKASEGNGAQRALNLSLADPNQVELTYEEFAQLPARRSIPTSRDSTEPLDNETLDILEGATHSQPEVEHCYNIQPPPFSWNELVTMALKSTPSQRLSTNGIYIYLREKFPYFKARGTGWKNALDVFLKRGGDFEQSSIGPEDSWGFAEKDKPVVPRRKRGRPPKRRPADNVQHASRPTPVLPSELTFIPVPKDVAAITSVGPPLSDAESGNLPDDGGAAQSIERSIVEVVQDVVTESRTVHNYDGGLHPLHPESLTKSTERASTRSGASNPQPRSGKSHVIDMGGDPTRAHSTRSMLSNSSAVIDLTESDDRPSHHRLGQHAVVEPLSAEPASRNVSSAWNSPKQKDAAAEGPDELALSPRTIQMTPAPPHYPDREHAVHLDIFQGLERRSPETARNARLRAGGDLKKSVFKPSPHIQRKPLPLSSSPTPFLPITEPSSRLATPKNPGSSRLFAHRNKRVGSLASRSPARSSTKGGGASVSRASSVRRTVHTPAPVVADSSEDELAL